MEPATSAPKVVPSAQPTCYLSGSAAAALSPVEAAASAPKVVPAASPAC